MGAAIFALPPQRPPAPSERRALDLADVFGGPRTPRLVFQPVVDLTRGTVVGYEALARFGHGPLKAPTPWFETAAQLGRSAELEAHLLAQALEVRQNRPAGCFLAVNISPALLATDPVRSVLAEAGSLDGVVLELTEHVEVDDLRGLRRRLDVLRDRGARLALDDAGAGYSGLRQVAELRPDIIKLDRSLVVDVDVDEVKAALVELLASFASRLDATLLVEGIERFEELDAVARIGVPLAQGWLLGRPTARWSDVDVDLATRLAFRAGMTACRSLVASHIDVTVPSVRHAVAAGLLASDPSDPDVVVLVDDEQRPTGLWLRDHDMSGPAGRVHPVTVVQPAESTSAVLARAMTRPKAVRFDPVVAVDASGTYVGVLDLQSLVLAGARALH